MVDMGKLQTYYIYRPQGCCMLGCVVALSLRRLGGTRLLAASDLRLSETDCGEDREGIVGVRLRGKGWDKTRRGALFLSEFLLG